VGTLYNASELSSYEAKRIMDDCDVSGVSFSSCEFNFKAIVISSSEYDSYLPEIIESDKDNNLVLSTTNLELIKARRTA
jgi:hypothetical protein